MPVKTFHGTDFTFHNPTPEKFRQNKTNLDRLSGNNICYSRSSYFLLFILKTIIPSEGRLIPASSSALEHGMVVPFPEQPGAGDPPVQRVEPVQVRGILPDAEHEFGVGHALLHPVNQGPALPHVAAPPGGVKPRQAVDQDTDVAVERHHVEPSVSDVVLQNEMVRPPDGRLVLGIRDQPSFIGRVDADVVSPIRTITKISKHTLLVKCIEVCSSTLFRIIFQNTTKQNRVQKYTVHVAAEKGRNILRYKGTRLAFGTRNLRPLLTLSACPDRRPPQTKRRCFADDSIPVWRSYARSGCRRYIHRNQSKKPVHRSFWIQPPSECIQTSTPIWGTRSSPNALQGTQEVLKILTYKFHSFSRKLTFSNVRFFRKTCPVTSAIYGFRDPSVLVGAEGYFEYTSIGMEGRVDNHIGKKLSLSDRDSYFNLPVIGSLAYYKSSELDHRKLLYNMSMETRSIAMGHSRCVVNGCKEITRNNENFSFHKFPKNKKLRKVWIDKINTRIPVTESSRICGKHFERSSYFLSSFRGSPKKRKLKNGVIPSLNLPNDTSVPSDDESIAKYPIKEMDPTISVKLEPCDAESVQMEDTAPRLQTDISTLKWDPKIESSNETILGLEVDYLTHDSTDETPSSPINTPNESELETSCTLFSIKEEPEINVKRYYVAMILQIIKNTDFGSRHFQPNGKKKCLKEDCSKEAKKGVHLSNLQKALTRVKNKTKHKNISTPQSWGHLFVPKSCISNHRPGAFRTKYQSYVDILNYDSILGYKLCHSGIRQGNHRHNNPLPSGAITFLYNGRTNCEVVSFGSKDSLDIQQCKIVKTSIKPKYQIKSKHPGDSTLYSTILSFISLKLYNYYIIASLVLTDSSQLTSDSQHLDIYSSPMASLVLTDSSQLTSDSQHLGIYSSPVASLVLTDGDSSQPTSDSQHLGVRPKFWFSEATAAKHMFLQIIWFGVGVKIEPYCTESFEMEDTKPILGCVGSEMQLNSHIHFSNETILGLEVDYINRDSNNETLSLAHTTNDSDSCTLPPIKEEPKVEFETLEESLKFEIKENDAHDTNTEMALSSFPPTKEPKKDIEDMLLLRFHSKTKSHIFGQEIFVCNKIEKIKDSMAQIHDSITNEFKDDYSIIDLRTDFNKRCLKDDCSKQAQQHCATQRDNTYYMCKKVDCSKRAVKGGYCVAHGGTKYNNICKKEDCSKHALKGGFCLAHGGTKSRILCNKDDCSKRAVKGGYCFKHGGIKYDRRCKKEDCSKYPGIGGYCVRHGGIKSYCKQEECSKQPLKGGFCSAHGGIKSKTHCKEKDCFKWPVKGGYCVTHGGRKSMKPCKNENCSSKPLKGGYCVAHGGTYYSRRCKKEACSKIPLKGGFCLTHGGTKYDKRCKKEDCSKLPEKGGYCVSHGGTKRHCKQEDCFKQPLKGGFCSAHGGTKRYCHKEDCSKQPLKGGFCSMHGGTKRYCKREDCSKQPLKGGFCLAHGGTKSGGVDYINHDSNNETLTLSLANTTNDSELKASCTLPPIKEESEVFGFIHITIEDTILSQSPRETKSHILNQDKSDCNDEEIHSVAQKHHCIANKFKAEDYLNICMKNDYSIADVSTNYKKKCWMYNCYKEAVKEGYCLKHGGNKSRKWCKMEDCTRCPVKGGYCKPHGGTTIRKLCKKEDCLKWPVKGGYCEAHGGIKSRKPCKKENCTKFPVKGGYCEPHGGTRTRKLCKMKDCSTTAVKGGYCIAHGGIKYDTRCNKEMCFKWPSCIKTWYAKQLYAALLCDFHPQKNKTQKFIHFLKFRNVILAMASIPLPTPKAFMEESDSRKIKESKLKACVPAPRSFVAGRRLELFVKQEKRSPHLVFFRHAALNKPQVSTLDITIFFAVTSHRGSRQVKATTQTQKKNNHLNSPHLLTSDLKIQIYLIMFNQPNYCKYYNNYFRDTLNKIKQNRVTGFVKEIIFLLSRGTFTINLTRTHKIVYSTHLSQRRMRFPGVDFTIHISSNKGRCLESRFVTGICVNGEWKITLREPPSIGLHPRFKPQSTRHTARVASYTVWPSNWVRILTTYFNRLHDHQIEVERLDYKNVLIYNIIKSNFKFVHKKNNKSPFSWCLLNLTNKIIKLFPDYLLKFPDTKYRVLLPFLVAIFLFANGLETRKVEFSGVLTFVWIMRKHRGKKPPSVHSTEFEPTRQKLPTLHLPRQNQCYVRPTALKRAHDTVRPKCSGSTYNSRHKLTGPNRHDGGGGTIPRRTCTAGDQKPFQPDDQITAKSNSRHNETYLILNSAVLFIRILVLFIEVDIESRDFKIYSRSFRYHKDITPAASFCFKYETRFLNGRVWTEASSLETDADEPDSPRKMACELDEDIRLETSSSLGWSSLSLCVIRRLSTISVSPSVKWNLAGNKEFLRISAPCQTATHLRASSGRVRAAPNTPLRWPSDPESLSTERLCGDLDLDRSTPGSAEPGRLGGRDISYSMSGGGLLATSGSSFIYTSPGYPPPL
uniref:THAP-type domain-containing protein n=1 Tax=Timema douglasi TaxID=61478 RepID=A0A7R8Z5H7_TIMDO|nr:unnamed protein product [Timema douglasi]